MTKKGADDASTQSAPIVDQDVGALALRPAQVLLQGGDQGKGVGVASSKEKSSKQALGRKDDDGTNLLVKKACSIVGTSATGFADGPEEVLTQTTLLSTEAVGQPH
ncbi:hypothetical protein V6N13_037810 [Hibiscus sabdariffa]|uniref:Uncharacterized protein n=1 Tax=Hibiscus sabdariffa TaxID=183260 RepID=A0ABR2S4V3_9ROSI